MRKQDDKPYKFDPDKEDETVGLKPEVTKRQAADNVPYARRFLYVVACLNGSHLEQAGKETKRERRYVAINKCRE